MQERRERTSYNEQVDRREEDTYAYMKTTREEEIEERNRGKKYKQNRYRDDDGEEIHTFDLRLKVSLPYLHIIRGFFHHRSIQQLISGVSEVLKAGSTPHGRRGALGVPILHEPERIS